ncbi:hypothetical protein K470DRAFT_254115 [Piedraia hortae CBS 480.64]|uniref:Uncharacterized protein n=1 Tax=Piedraia hortae CBS 480.64 TaxID=1314780 RepID=A0A6A7CC54_9PEZI|nr:hypothetical protein K470DRAFT_254115 [Piedraia hortae CBS 480.64]
MGGRSFFIQTRQSSSLPIKGSLSSHEQCSQDRSATHFLSHTRTKHPASAVPFVAIGIIIMAQQAPYPANALHGLREADVVI